MSLLEQIGGKNIPLASSIRFIQKASSQTFRDIFSQNRAIHFFSTNG